MKKNSFLSVFVFIVLGFYSCKSDEPYDQDGGKQPVDSSMLVSSIVEGTSKYDFSKFEYDENNRLVKGVYEGNPFSISFSPLQITLGLNTKGEKEGEQNIKYKDIQVNENGYITKMTAVIWYNTYEGETRVFEKFIDINYQDGYMKRFMFQAHDYTDFSEEYIFVWEDGNLVKVTCISKEQISNESDEYDERIYNDVFDYGDGAPVNSGIYIPDMCVDDLDFLYYAGYLGKSTSKIPTKITNGEYHDDITVAFDSKGRITEYKTGNYLEQVYAYDGKDAVWPK